MRLAVSVHDAFFSPNGRLVVTVSDALRVWDANTGKMILAPMRFSMALNGAALSRNGRHLVVGCGSAAIFAKDPGYAQVLDMVTGWPLTPRLWRELFVRGARFSPDARRIATTCWVGGTLLWDLKPDERSLDDLIRMAAILSGSRVDTTGAAVPVATSELQEDYEALLHNDSRAFTASPEQVLGWHHQRAQECEAARAWDAAIQHLDRLIEDGPKVDALAIRRGLARAELGHWQKAAGDFDFRKLAPQTRFSVWRLTALVHLGSDDRDGYRAACAGMLEHFGQQSDSETNNNLAWIRALAPDVVADPARLVSLAETAVAARPGDHACLNTLGAVLYRAGRYADSVRRLEESMAASRDGDPVDWLFLAMAHQRLGHADQARRRLDQAMAAVDQAIGNYDRGDQAMTAVDQAIDNHDRGAELMELESRLTLTLLRSEAKAVLGLKTRPGEALKETTSKEESPPR